MKDWREIQRYQMEREGRQLIEEVTLEQARINARQGLYPVGSVHMWAMNAMFGPMNKGQQR